MNIGFYSPLKSPMHAVPSGDREMARALILLLETMGHVVTPICRLRSFDRDGDHVRQLKIRSLSEHAAEIIRRRHPSLDLIFTYHVYHKAPDWIGPRLQATMKIPYLMAEASIAGKQQDGPWDLGHQATVAAVRTADHVFAMTGLDAQALAKFVQSPEHLSLLPPFTTLPKYVGKTAEPMDPTRLLCVAMMRNDVKLHSYRLLAEALKLIDDLPWSLDIVGDGPAKSLVVEAFARLGGRVRFLGRAEREHLGRHYSNADVFVWPGLREAYGIVYLEAQAHGLPVVAVDNCGVPEVVRHGETGLLCAEASATSFADQLRRLVCEPELRVELAGAARPYIENRHSFESAKSAIQNAFARMGLS